MVPVSYEQLTYRRNCDHEKSVPRSVPDKMQSPSVGNLSPSPSFIRKLKRLPLPITSTVGAVTRW